MKTRLGWTLMGKVPTEQSDQSLSMFAISLLVNDNTISNLWNLDITCITEESQRKSRQQQEETAYKFFMETISIHKNGRYEVRLPWLEKHPTLPSNYLIAQKRLRNNLRKLKENNLLKEYGTIFKEWLQLDIIELRKSDEFCNNTQSGHFLPH